MVTVIGLIVFAIGFGIFVIYGIRELGEKDQFFTTYPRQGLLGAIEDGDVISYVLDGDTPPNSLLYDHTKTSPLGLYKKRKPIPWETHTLHLIGDEKPTQIEIVKGDKNLLRSIPKLFPVAVLAPIIALNNLKGALLINFTFRVNEDGEKEFLMYVLNTRDWIDTLIAPLLSLADEYAKKKELLAIKGDDCVSLDKDFQKKFREIGNKEHKVYKIMHLTLVGVELANFIEDISPEVQKAFDEKARIDAQNASDLAYETGQNAILDMQLVNAKKKQDIENVEIEVQKKYAAEVTIPIIKEGGDLTAAVIAAQKTGITTFAVGSGATVAVGNNNSSQQKTNSKNEEKKS